MKVFLLITAITTILFHTKDAAAQVPEIPVSYQLEKEDDYAAYRDKVIACIKWIQQTHPDEEAKNRNEANAFVMKWLMGSPDVAVELKTDIMTSVEKKYKFAPELGGIFLYGKALYVMEHPGQPDEAAAIHAGLASMIRLYNIIKEKDSQLISRTMEKYISMQEGEELDAYVKKKLKM